jgi:hypothetical protein
MRRQGRVWAVVLVAMTAVLAGCGGEGNPLLTSSPPGTATTASNHRLAVAETTRLLNSVQLPPGAARAASPGTRLLDQPGDGRFVGATDGTRYWRIHEPYNPAIAWINAHAPAGSKPGGFTMTQGSKVISTVGGFTYFPPSSPAWQNVQLSVEATALSSNETAVRADAQVQWLDPTPYSDSPRGRRLHVVATGSCAPSVNGYTDVTNTGAGLRAALLPPGPVTSVLVCRYGEPSPETHPDLRLTLSRRLDSRALHYLVARTRTIVVAHPTVVAPAGCAGMALSMVVVVAFGYASGRSVDLWLEPLHCTAVEDNGVISAPLDGTVYAALQLTTPAIEKDG